MAGADAVEVSTLLFDAGPAPKAGRTTFFARSGLRRSLAADGLEAVAVLVDVFGGVVARAFVTALTALRALMGLAAGDEAVGATCADDDTGFAGAVPAEELDSLNAETASTN